MWARLPTVDHPVARCAHQAESIGDKMYVFGGWSETQMLNDLKVLDCESLTWSDAYDDNVDLSFVACRSGHSMNAIGKKLLVFGGGAVVGSANVFLNDTLLFDIESKKWTLEYSRGQTPGGRTKHTSNVVNSTLFVFGGGDGLRLYDDVYALDIETLLWSRPNPKGTPPSPRWGHSTVQVGNQLVVFGGHEGVNRVNDVHILDTVSMTWRREQCPGRIEGEVPRPRAGHTANMVGPHMLAWGGGDGRVLPNMYGLDTRNWRWWLAGTTPPRCAHTTTVVGNKLVAFGGGDGVACFNDLYFLDIGDQLETLYQAKPQATSPGSQHRATAFTSPIPTAETSPSAANRPVPRQNNKKNMPLQKVAQSQDSVPLRPPGSPPPSTRRRSNSKNKNNPNNHNNNLNSVNIANNQVNTHPPNNYSSSNMYNNSKQTPPPPPSFRLDNDPNKNTDTNNTTNTAAYNNSVTKNGAVQGISLWLTSLGMSKYLERFLAEEIDMDIIDMISDSHLKLLGIPLGDRLRLGAAICRLPGRV